MLQLDHYLQLMFVARKLLSTVIVQLNLQLLLCSWSASPRIFLQLCYLIQLNSILHGRKSIFSCYFSAELLRLGGSGGVRQEQWPDRRVVLRGHHPDHLRHCRQVRQVTSIICVCMFCYRITCNLYKRPCPSGSMSACAECPIFRALITHYKF